MRWKKILTIEVSAVSADIVDLTNRVYNIQKILNMGLEKSTIRRRIELILHNMLKIPPYTVGDYKLDYEIVSGNINITFFKKMETSTNKPYVASYVAYMATEELANLYFDNSVKDRKSATRCIQKWLTEHLVFPKGTQLTDSKLELLFNNEEVWLDENSFLIMDPMTESVHYYVRKYKVECANSSK